MPGWNLFPIDVPATPSMRLTPVADPSISPHHHHQQHHPHDKSWANYPQPPATVYQDLNYYYYNLSLTNSKALQCFLRVFIKIAKWGKIEESKIIYEASVHEYIKRTFSLERRNPCYFCFVFFFCLFSAKKMYLYLLSKCQKEVTLICFMCVFPFKKREKKSQIHIIQRKHSVCDSSYLIRMIKFWKKEMKKIKNKVCFFLLCPFPAL